MGGQSIDDGVNPSNLSYKFALNTQIIDNSSTAGLAELDNNFGNETINLNDGYTYTNKSFRSHRSPYKSGLLRGYKRGEVYRFGVVFYNKKGESSYVEYIGDIKMPDISEEAGYTTANAPGAGPRSYFPVCSSKWSNEVTVGAGDDITYGHDLGLKIDFDFTSCPSILDKITSFQIVRCKRTNGDKRRPASGVVKPYHYPTVGENPHFPGEGYNWDDPEGANILHQYWTEPTSTNPTDSQNPHTGSWYSLNNDWHEYRRFDAEENYSPIYGDFLAFYSPEVSYNFNTEILSGVGKAFLITGAYGYYGYTQNPMSGTPVQRYYSNDIKTNLYGTTDSNQELGCIINEEYFKVRQTSKIDKETVAELPDGTQDTLYNDAGGTHPTLYRGIEYIKQFLNNGLFTEFEKAQEDVEPPTDRMPKIIKTYGPLATDAGGSLYVRPVYVFVDNEGADGTDPDDDCPCQVSMPGSAFDSFTSRACGYGGLGRGGSSLTVNTTNIFNNPYSGDPVVPGTVGTAFRAVPTNTAIAINAGPC